MPSDEVSPDRQLVAMAMPYIAWRSNRSELPPVADPLPLVASTALDWQKIGAHAIWAELHGTKAGADRDRMYELVGRVASAGEQLGLGWSFLREAEFWHAAGTADDEAQRATAIRGLSEVTRYFGLAAGHGVANCTIRTLVLESQARTLLNARYKAASGFQPLDHNQRAWLAYNESVVDSIQNAADAAGSQALKDLAACLATCLSDSRWTQLAAMRAVDFHRWRPQSIPGGVPTQSAWSKPSEGSWRLTMYTNNPFPPPDPQASFEAARDGLDALAEMMDTWLARWPAALRDAGVPVFKADNAET